MLIHSDPEYSFSVHVQDLPCGVNTSIQHFFPPSSSHKATLKRSCISHIENLKLNLNVTKNFCVNRHNPLELNGNLGLREFLCQAELICTWAFNDASCVDSSMNYGDPTLTNWWTETLLNQMYLDSRMWHVDKNECLENLKLLVKSDAVCIQVAREVQTNIIRTTSWTLWCMHVC